MPLMRLLVRVLEKITIYDIYKNYIKSTDDFLRADEKLDAIIVSLPHIISTVQPITRTMECKAGGYFRGLFQSVFRCDTYNAYESQYIGIFSRNKCSCRLDASETFSLDFSGFSEARILSLQDQNKFSSKNTYIFKDNIACAPNMADYTKSNIKQPEALNVPTWPCAERHVDNIKISIERCNVKYPKNADGQYAYSMKNSGNLHNGKNYCSNAIALIKAGSEKKQNMTVLYQNLRVLTIR